MIYPCFDLNTADYVYCVMTDAVVVCQFFSSVTVWLSIKHDGFGKRLCQSAKISHTISCNISLYRDTKEVIYRYTQNVYHPISALFSVHNYIKTKWWNERKDVAWCYHALLSAEVDRDCRGVFSA